LNCTLACPRGIEVTRALGEVKLTIRKGSPEDIIVPDSIQMQGLMIGNIVLVKTQVECQTVFSWILEVI
jgi:hypothetical protein